MSIRGAACITGAYEHQLRKAPDTSPARLHAGVAPGIGALTLADHLGLRPGHVDSVTHQAPEPWVIVYVTLDEGPTLMTNVVDTPHDEIAIGDRAERVVRPTPHGIHAPFFRRQT